MLIGYMRVSKADGSQVVDLQRDASCLRDELSLARGRSLAQVLAGPRPAVDDLPAATLAVAR